VEVAPYHLVSMNAAEQAEENAVQNEEWPVGDAVFTVLAAQPDLLSESSRFVANTPDPFAPEDATGLQPVS
jgi:hypothetical protein